MPDHLVQKSSDLAGDERLIVERWLGRALSNDETISINAYRPHSAPDPEEQQNLRSAIIMQAREIGAREGNISDREIDGLLSDAIEGVRNRRS